MTAPFTSPLSAMQVNVRLKVRPRHDDRMLAGYAALAVTLQLIEGAIPSPVPGIKPGLANVVTLIVLARHGWKAAVAVSLLRVVLGSLMIGSVLGAGFWLSLSGAVSALLAMGGLYGLGQKLPVIGRVDFRPSAIGYSLIAAQAHALAQFSLARLWLIPGASLDRLLLPLLLAALLFGLITGWLAQGVLSRLTAAAPSSRAI